MQQQRVWFVHLWHNKCNGNMLLSGAPEADELQKKQEELMPQIQENAAAAAYLQAQMRWS